MKVLVSGLFCFTRRFFLVIAVIFPSVLLAQVKIAALMPMSGDLSEYGVDSVKGVELAVDEINQAGGVLGGQDIQIVLIDTKTDPAEAVNSVRAALAEHRIAGMIGAMSTPVVLELADQIARNERLPMISHGATTVAISSADDDDFLFRTTAHEAQQSVLLARTVLEQGLESISIVYAENDYGRDISEVFAEHFTKAGGRIVASVGFAPGRPSYQQQLVRAGADKADALFLIADPGDGFGILKQSIESGLFDRFIFSDRMRSDGLVQAIPQLWLDGSIGSAPVKADSIGRQHFDEAFKSRYGSSSGLAFVDSAYDATYLLAIAIEKAQSDEGAAVRDALRLVAGPPGITVLPGQFERAKKFLAANQDIDYSGASGLQDFDAAGDVAGSVGIWTVRDGKIAELKREQL